MRKSNIGMLPFIAALGIGLRIPMINMPRFTKKPTKEDLMKLRLAQEKRDKRNARNKANWKAQQDNYYFVNSNVR